MASDAPTLRRRRRKPLNTRTAEAAKWTDWVGIAGFAILLLLTILGPSMTSENYGIQSQIRTYGYVVVLALAVVGL